MTPILRPPAEIHILKPEGGKAFVEATQLEPHRPRNHQKRPRWLFHLETGRIVQAQTAISPVHRVVRPDLVKQEDFQTQGGRRRKLADHESDLGAAVCVEQASAGAGRSGQAAGFAERLEAADRKSTRLNSSHLGISY